MSTQQVVTQDMIAFRKIIHASIALAALVATITIADVATLTQEQLAVAIIKITEYIN